jgi:hypothetical protein
MVVMVMLLLLLAAGHNQWPWPRAEHRAVPHQERDPNRCSNQPRQQVRWQGVWMQLCADDDCVICRVAGLAVS